MGRIDEILAELRASAENPRAGLDAVLQSGQKAIGCMPMYCPKELVTAAGMRPFEVWGADTEVSEAKKYFPAFICSVMQTCMELGLRGDLDGLSGMMIPALCDSMKTMGQNWKAGIEKIPYIPLFHPQNRGSGAGVTFLVSEYGRVLKRLEEISGKKVSDGDIEAAIDVYNAQRLAMRRFAGVAAVYPQAVTPSARSAVYKSAGFMEAAGHAALVKELCDELEKLPVQPWKGKKIVVTGILADSPALLKIFEEYNIAVAADEVAAESRRFRTPVPGGGKPLERLARQFAAHEGCSVAFDPGKKRGGMILDMVKKTGADGIVVLMTKFCDPEEFDYAILRKQFAAADVPHIQIEVDRQTNSYEQARTALQAFVDVM